MPECIHSGDSGSKPVGPVFLFFFSHSLGKKKDLDCIREQFLKASKEYSDIKNAINDTNLLDIVQLGNINYVMMFILSYLKDRCRVSIQNTYFEHSWKHYKYSDSCYESSTDD